MITVLPVERPAEETLRLLCGASGTVFETRERGTLLGAMAVQPEKNVLRITAFAAPGMEQREGQAIAELMLRAAASFARNRMLPFLVCGNTFPRALAERFNFVQIAEEWRLETGRFLSGCKNCEKS